MLKGNIMSIGCICQKSCIFAELKHTDMKIGVIIAMDIEYRQMHDALGGDTGRLGNNEIVLWQCGIGKVNAAVGTMRLVQKQHPDAIISTGLAGGIDQLFCIADGTAVTVGPGE